MNLSNKQSNKGQGFSIIEVVLVLAVAGLIFLMVFIAAPALYRGERDSDRKKDVSLVTVSIRTFMSSNRNSLSGLTTAKLQDYIDELGQYEKSSVTVDTVFGGGNVTAATDTMQVRLGAVCPEVLPAPGDMIVVTEKSTANRRAAVVTALENNGDKEQAYCQDI